MNEPRREIVQRKMSGPRRRLNGAAGLRRQRGVMALTMPIVLVMAMAAGALAVDIGHLYAVKAELQTAADAASLAGAASLLPSTGAPKWSAAQAAATSGVALNTSDGVTLHDATVQTGYWNVTGTPAQMQATTITPGNNDTAAVQVTVSRAPGLNGGPVSYFLAPLFGMRNGPVSATAVAMVSGPGMIAAKGLFPMAISNCTAQYYLKLGTSTQVNIGDGGTPPTGCSSTAQWTNLGTGNKGASTVQSLMNSNPVSINDLINLVTDTGVKASLYKDVKQSSNPAFVGSTVVMPVITDASSTASQGVVGFAAFHIVDATWQGNSKHITGYFVPGYKIPTTGNGQVGPYYGAYLPPRLVQ